MTQIKGWMAGAAAAALALVIGISVAIFSFSSSGIELYDGWEDAPAADVRMGEQEVRLAMALDYALQQGGDEARIALEKFANFRASRAALLAQAAEQENDARKLQAALKYGASASALQPDNPSHWVNLGRIYQMAGRFDPMEATEAPVMFTRALALDETYKPALLALGQWHFEKMQYDRSLPYLERLIEQDASYLSQNWFVSLLTNTYILAGKADIGANRLATLETSHLPGSQKAIAILARESNTKY